MGVLVVILWLVGRCFVTTHVSLRLVQSASIHRIRMLLDQRLSCVVLHVLLQELLVVEFLLLATTTRTCLVDGLATKAAQVFN